MAGVKAKSYSYPTSAVSAAERARARNGCQLRLKLKLKLLELDALKLEALAKLEATALLELEELELLVETALLLELLTELLELWAFVGRHLDHPPVPATSIDSRWVSWRIIFLPVGCVPGFAPHAFLQNRLAAAPVPAEQWNRPAGPSRHQSLEAAGHFLRKLEHWPT